MKRQSSHLHQLVSVGRVSSTTTARRFIALTYADDAQALLTLLSCRIGGSQVTARGTKSSVAPRWTDVYVVRSQHNCWSPSPVIPPASLELSAQPHLHGRYEQVQPSPPGCDSRRRLRQKLCGSDGGVWKWASSTSSPAAAETQRKATSAFSSFVFERLQLHGILQPPSTYDGAEFSPSSQPPLPEVVVEEWSTAPTYYLYRRGGDCRSDFPTLIGRLHVPPALPLPPANIEYTPPPSSSQTVDTGCRGVVMTLPDFLHSLGVLEDTEPCVGAASAFSFPAPAAVGRDSGQPRGPSYLWRREHMRQSQPFSPAVAPIATHRLPPSTHLSTVPSVSRSDWVSRCGSCLPPADEEVEWSAAVGVLLLTASQPLVTAAEPKGVAASQQLLGWSTAFSTATGRRRRTRGDGGSGVGLPSSVKGGPMVAAELLKAFLRPPSRLPVLLAPPSAPRTAAARAAAQQVACHSVRGAVIDGEAERSDPSIRKEASAAPRATHSSTGLASIMVYAEAAFHHDWLHAYTGPRSGRSSGSPKPRDGNSSCSRYAHPNAPSGGGSGSTRRGRAHRLAHYPQARCTAAQQQQLANHLLLHTFFTEKKRRREQQQVDAKTPIIITLHPFPSSAVLVKNAEWRKGNGDVHTLASEMHRWGVEIF